jgi:N-acetylglutamate synthase-like GNAT family acetyltransferase
VIPFLMRRANIEDAARVTDLLVGNKLPTAGVDDGINEFSVADIGDKLIGVIGMELYGKNALLRSAAVSSERQGQGIGRALVGEMLSKARSRGVADIFLLTTTAEKYFESFGFTKIERAEVPDELGASEELRGACPDTATVMRLVL